MSTSSNTGHYIYVAPTIEFRGTVDGCQLSKVEQQFKLLTNQECVHLFGEPDSPTKGVSRRTAFELLMNDLKPQSVVKMWTWTCLINLGRLNKTAADVEYHIRQIHDRDASIVFVNEKLDTSKATDRLVLATTLANAQYLYDVTIENSSKVASSGCCVKSACCSALATGC
jgi:DNA invertase Pin-like site-specific DNA recombinase